jgi:hypothetical protein
MIAELAELEENVRELTGAGVDCAKNGLRAVWGGLGGRVRVRTDTANLGVLATLFCGGGGLGGLAEET